MKNKKKLTISDFTYQELESEIKLRNEASSEYWKKLYFKMLEDYSDLLKEINKNK
jgi:hypothetical protein